MKYVIRILRQCPLKNILLKLNLTGSFWAMLEFVAFVLFPFGRVALIRADGSVILKSVSPVIKKIKWL